MKRLLLLKVGSTLPELSRRRGDFERWFIDGLGIDEGRVEVMDAQRVAPSSSTEGAAGVLITGSHAMVSHREPWSEAVARWLPGVVEGGIPLLGICYGHQLLAHALGGEVGPNPNGPELGTVRVQLTDEGRADPLLGGLSDGFAAQVAHEEAVLTLPPGARLLAQSADDPHLAFAVGEQAWGIQFHPEFDASIVRAYLTARAGRLRDRFGLDASRLMRATSESPEAGLVLRRFGELLGS